MSATVVTLRLEADAYSDALGDPWDDGLGCAHGLAAGLLIMVPFWVGVAWMIFA